MRVPVFIFDFCILIFGFPAYAEDKPYDYLIKDALVFEGESLTLVQQDIAISGNRIALMGEIAPEDASEVIEAEGLVASPGFIDIHTHSDFNPFVYTNLGNKVLQGVTTEVVGNCGMSAAPVLGPHEGEIVNVWSREGVQIPRELPWKGFADYTNEAEFQGLDTNFVGLVGHGNLRSSVMGMEARPARPEELESMKALLGETLEEGAFGVSFGLTYLPGVFATREELVTLCRESGTKGGLCVFHIRSEGNGLVEAIQEAIDVGREARARIHISHLKASGGEKNWPKIQEAFRLIEQAQTEGLEVTADAYPYEASFAELAVILPDKIYQDPNRLDRFKDPRQRGKILRELRKHYEANPPAWDRIRIATVTQEKNTPLQGKSLLVISQAANQSPVEVLMDLLSEEEFRVSAFYFSQSEAVVSEVLSKDYVAIGSDSIADGSSMPHPRAYGTFPRRLAGCRTGPEAARNPCWGQAIQQMTELPARILGLNERGRITSGFYADVVLFDPATVQDRSDYDNPKAPPDGIRWVFVNGKPVVREGKYEPARSGLFLTAEK